MALISLADAKLHLNIPSATTTDDTELTRLLAVVEDAAAAYFGAPVGTGSTVTESHHGGWTTLVLRQVPVLTVSTITVSGTALATTSIAIDTSAGVVHSLAGAQGSDPVDTTVVYSTGYSSVPDDIVQGALELLRHLWTTQRGSMSGRNPFSDDGYAQAAPAWSLPRRVTELWSAHRTAPS